MPFDLAALLNILRPKQPMLPGLESSMLERIAPQAAEQVFTRDQSLLPLLSEPRFQRQLELPDPVGIGETDPHSYWNPPDLKQLGVAKGLDADLAAIARQAQTSFDESGKRSGRRIIPGPPEEPVDFNNLPGRDFTGSDVRVPGAPKLPENERIDPEHDLGVYQEPSFMLDTPVLKQLQEMTSLPRRADSRVGRVAQAVSRMLEKSGLSPDEMANAQDLLDRFMKRVRTPIELGSGEMGSGEGDPESGLGVRDALDILKDLRNRMNPGKIQDKDAGVGLLSPEELAQMQESDDPAKLELAQRSEARAENLALKQRLSAADPQKRAREAVQVLDAATGLKAGGDISDYTGDSRPGYLLGTLKGPERIEKAQYAQSVNKARIEEGKPLPADRRNQQYAPHQIRHWAPSEEVVNPEAVSGLRPGVTGDPFEDVLSGNRRSILVPATETIERGYKRGQTIILRSGDGRVIPAEIVDIRAANRQGAQEVGLRQGLTKNQMAQHLDMKTGRSEPQHEIIFKPLRATRPGLESSAVTEEPLRLGAKAAVEAYSGIGKARPAPELNLSPKIEAKLRAEGYGPALDAPSLPRGKATGAPFILIHPSGEKARVVYVAGQGANDRARAIANAQALKEPQEIVGAANIKKLIRPMSAGEFRAAPKDTSQLGRGPNVPDYTKLEGEREEATANTMGGRGAVSGDRRDMEFRPTSIGKDVTQPEVAMNVLRGGAPKGTFMITEHYDAKYPGRTWFNAQNSDVTLAIAKDFGTGGEALTRRAAGGKYVPVQLEHLENKQAIDRTAAAINKITKAAKDKGIILNIAGNGLNTLRRGGQKTTQAELNARVLQFVKSLVEHPGRDYEIKGIITGGQTGLDEAGAMAGKQLGIPTSVNMPNKYTMRDTETGMDIWTDRDLQKARFAGDPNVEARFQELGRAGAQKLKEWKAKNPQGGS